MEKIASTDFKDLGFKRHPLAPCLALMYEGEPLQLTGLITVETDDLLGGGTGDKYFQALETLKRKYRFGTWKELMDTPHEYGGRTLRQFED